MLVEIHEMFVGDYSSIVRLILHYVVSLSYLPFRAVAFSVYAFCFGGSFCFELFCFTAGDRVVKRVVEKKKEGLCLVASPLLRILCLFLSVPSIVVV